MSAVLGAGVAVAALILGLIVLVAGAPPAAALGIAAATAALLTWLILRSAARAIDHVSDAATAIATGNLARRIETPPSAFTDTLVEHFNEMAGNIEKFVQGASLDRGRLIAALNSSLDAILAVDRAGDIRFANTAAARLAGMDAKAAVGKALAWVLPEPQVIDTMRAVLADPQPSTGMVERSNRQFYRITAAPIVGGGDWAVLLLLHDLTEVRRVEQVRRDFIGNVSHELRTPLSAVKAVVETLADGALSDPTVAQEFLGRANAEVDRLIQIVEDQLELSRIESGEVQPVHEPVDLGAVARDVIERLEPLAEQAGLVLHIEAPGELPLVMGDTRQLERALLNLVQNAIKFTPAGGSVSVRVEDLAGANVRVSVSDTGVGIEAKDLPRVFERFYKGDHSRGSAGSGLGLAIVKHTIEAHGGQVAVESAPGRGAVFTFVLPVMQDAE